MSDSQHSHQTSDSVFAKLQEVDSELALQEAQLLSQLANVREKRQSLQTVIGLFATVDAPTTATLEEQTQILPPKINGEPKIGSKDLAVLKIEGSEITAAAKPQTEAASANGKPKATQTPPASRSDRTSRQTGKATKPTSGWQQYLREEFQGTSLPEAVSVVLQRREKQVFEIAAVVNAIFEPELPKDMRDKARHQITNILAEGARKNKWYRGRAGTYSFSRTAAKANSK